MFRNSISPKKKATTGNILQPLEQEFDCLIINESKEIIVIDDDDDDEENIEQNNSNENYEEISSRMPNFFYDVTPQNCNNKKHFQKNSFYRTNHKENKKTVENNQLENQINENGNNLDKLNYDQDDSINELYAMASKCIENMYGNNDEIICLDDDSIVTNVPATSNSQENKSLDDSVIFISEFQPTTSKALDYIPLESPTQKSHTKLISSVLKPLKRPAGNLFTASEHKKIRIYNTNTYNPNKDCEELKKGKRMVLIDGSNIAFHHALNKVFSVKGIEICLEYFEKMGHSVKAIVPQFRLQKGKSTDPEKLDSLFQNGKIVFTPCKNLPGKFSSCYDDRFILQLGIELDAAIVSNDNYRDLIHENPAFKKIIENRVIGYTWCNDLFILPKDPYGRLGPNLSTILNRT